MGNDDEGPWLEAIALFESVREGRQAEAGQLLATSSDQQALMGNLLRMLGVYLRGEEGSKLDRFIAASHRAGPPPAAGPLDRNPPLP